MRLVLPILRLTVCVALLQANAWGDFSRSGQWSTGGAGGVGGLLMLDDKDEGVHFYAYDGNGNVAGLFDADDSSLSARYEYDPYGNVLVQTGPMAEINRFRFSTKYQDAETGLLYFGFRYYNPSTGMWISPDPLGESGGLNLYSFNAGSPVNFYDPYGLAIGDWYDVRTYFNEGFVEGYQVGAVNVGEALADLVKSPYYAAESGGQVLGYLSTAYGRERFSLHLDQATVLIGRFREDECFRKAILSELGEEFREYFTDPEKLSRLLADIGVTAATGGLGLASSGLNGVGKLGKLARLLERFLPDDDTISSAMTGRRAPGKILGLSELQRIQVGLERRGARFVPNADHLIDRYGKNKVALHVIEDGDEYIYTRKNATRSELFHEIRHHVQFRREAGGNQAAWNKISEEAKERFVLRYMLQQKWLTDGERKQAIRQVTQFR